jgi:hypothetical protein
MGSNPDKRLKLCLRLTGLDKKEQRGLPELF